MRPTVSICCTTFNHENYIGKCIDGFLMQQTDFPIEILIFEDASSDGTAEIVRKYAAQDDRIITFIQTENQWLQQKYGITDWLFPAAKGKYIALCEGDDYWTDSLKLQKQVDAMEAVHSLSMVLTNADKLIDGALTAFYPYSVPPSEFNLRQFTTNRYPVATCTALLKREVLAEVVIVLTGSKFNFFHLDFFIWCIAGRQGQYRFLDIKTGVYRINSSGIVRSTPMEVTLQRGKEMNHFLADYLGPAYKRHFLAGDWWYHLEFAFLAIQEKQWLRSIAFLSRSLISATRYGQGRQLQIMRDYLYRVRNRRDIN